MRIQTLHAFRQTGCLRWLLLPLLAALLRANSVYDVVSTSPSQSTYWKRSDIILSSRVFHDRPNKRMTTPVYGVEVPLEMDTFEAADSFFANRIEWVYFYETADLPMLQEAQNRGIKMSLTLNTILRDDPNQPYGSWTYIVGRTTNVLNKPTSRPDLLSKGILEGCARNPAYRQIWLNHAKWLIDKNPSVITTLQMDDVAMNIQYLENGGCYCDHCNIGFRSYISTNLTSAQRTAAGITDVNTFSYRDYLRNLGQPATEKISVGTPELKDAYVAYQTANTFNFYDEVHRSLTNYYHRQIFFAANTRGGGNKALVALHDQLIEEYSTADPHAIYDTIVDHATYSGKPLLLTYDRDLEVFNNRLFAASCYAAGANGIIPWDVFSGVTEYTANQTALPRFFGARKDFAPIYGFVKALSQYLDEYEDAGMFIKSRTDPRYSAPPVIVEDNPSVVVFVRAQLDPFAPVVVHIIRKDPTDTAPVTLTLNPDAFYNGPIQKTLYTIPAYNQTVHNNARTTGNYSALALNSTTPQLTDVTATQIQIPAFDLWAMLILEPATGNLIQPSIQTRRLKIEPQQEVQILNSGKGTIRYTLNGTEPTETSTIYAAPFVISSAATIKAKAFLNGVATPTSTAVVQNLPFFDIAADPSTRLWLRPSVDLSSLADKAPVTAWVPTKGPTLRPTATALPTGKLNTPPTYTTNGLGGLPGVYFNGTNSIAASGLMNLYGISKEFTVVMSTMAEDGEFGLSGNAIQGGGSIPRFFMQRNLFTYGDPAVLVSIPSGYGVELTTVRMTAAGQIDVFKNGGKLGSATTAIAPSFGGGNFAVPYGVSTLVPEGVLGEVIVISRALSDQELESIHQLRQAKPTAASTSSIPMVDEGFLLTLNLSNIFPNVSVANSTFSYAEGPSGISVSSDGVLTWTPTEAQGPSTNTLGIRITQTSPTQVYTNYMAVIVRELNASPVLIAPPTLTVNEGSTLSFQLSASDSDIPNNTLSYSKVSGPADLNVSSTGLITWATTEASGPSTNVVSVRVLDNGVPIRSDIRQIEVIVKEVNVAPVAVAPATQVIDQFLPLNLQLTATDADLPANEKTFALISGPDGATISPTGLAQWVPTDDQAPSTNTFTFSVTDNGDPALSSTGSFTVIASAVTQRLVWQIGVDEPAGISATLYYDEFRIQNNVNDAKPGRVTRVSGDPEYNATSNPVQDDDFYTAGIYPAGFNGLTAMLRVPFDEPASAWEYNHTLGDRTNRLHFRLSAAQVDPATTLRILVDLPVGGWSLNGTAQTTFGDHDYVIRFVNGLGVGTNVYAGRISKATILSVVFTAGAAQATLGANTLEFLRTGPAAAGASYYLIYDHLRLEVDPGGNSAPVFADVPNYQIDEQVAWSQQIGATDVDLPKQALTYTLLSGPSGLAVNPAGIISWTPTEAQGPNTYSFTVKVTDDGVPALSATNTFQVTVLEVNVPPVSQAVPLQHADKFMPVNLQLAATDVDAPPNLLSYGLISGPPGLIISSSGLAQWMPIASQTPSTNVVTYTVTDSGTPALTTTNFFTVVARPVESRSLWLIGTNHPPGTPVATTYSELGTQNNINDPKPGNVTLSPGDPDYTAPNTPARDDDFYFKGIYPAGFNGLTTNRVVYSDEPWSAWENNHTLGDRTNRMHFRLNQAEILSGSVLTLSFEFTSAGFSINGVSQAPKVGSHDFVVRFINGNGLQTQVYAATLTTLTNIVVTIPATSVQATLGANSLEFVRTGPALTGYSYYLIYDYVRLESNAGSNTIPEPTPVPTITTDEGVLLSRTLTATDANTPAQTLTFSKVSGPSGLTIGSDGSLAWKPTAAQGPSTNTIVARVTDNGSPALSSDFQFTIIVTEPQARLLWQIGDNDDPAVVPFNPEAGFGLPNNATDGAPGSVTRLVGDPAYDAKTNPAADDDFYFKGTYPAGYFGNSGMITVPNDEPDSAWESRLTTTDPLNRFHFTLNTAQTGPTARLLLNLDLPLGGFTEGGNPGSGFGQHDVAIRFRNGQGVLTTVYSGQLTSATNLLIEIKALDVSATVGPNAIEIERTGPSFAGIEHWLAFDYVKMESTFTLNTSPIFNELTGTSVNELEAFRLQIGATDNDTPTQLLTFSLVDGPPEVNLTSGGLLTAQFAESRGPASYPVRVRVTDNGIPPLSTTNGFSLVVREVNRAPSLNSLDITTVDEGDTVSLNPIASDPDLPANALIFEKLSGPTAITVTEAGTVSWVTGENDGPSTNTLVLRVVDNGSPALSATNSYTIIIREKNLPPVVQPVSTQTVNELTPFRLSLAATDPDIPANTIVYSLVSGPQGVIVGTGGLLTWTPTEAQGPSVNTVIVRATDNGEPAQSATNQFTVIVREVNTAPTLGAVPIQTIEAGSSMNLFLTASDTDLPPNGFTYSLVSGPADLTVSAGGTVSWSPSAAFVGSTNTVTVKVTDDGTSPLSDTESFVVIVTERQTRLLWQIGVDDVDTSNPEGEFGAPNGLIDAAPGTVTSPPGSPNYNVSSNPGADDDFYFAGRYPAGYYGNSTVLNVSEDEPSSAWESRLTSSDPRNRFHFLLNPAQTGISARLILTVELPIGGVSIDGVPQAGFGSHPLLIRFRNSTGAVTPIYYNTISSKTRLVLDIPATSVAASAGANSIEFEQWGTPVSNTDSWLAFDFVKMESIFDPNTPPVFNATADLTLDELVPFTINLTATDSDTYSDALVFGLISGPTGLTVASNGRLDWTPGEADGPSTNSVMIRVTDNGVPPLSATNAYTIIVRELNRSPQINVVTAQTVDELTLLTVNLSATDPDLPLNTSTFALVDPPAGAAITPDGIFTWTPTEAQGPALTNITVMVTDGGTPPLSATRQFAVTVNEVNAAPVLTPIPDQTIAFSASLAINLSATDPDLPANTLTYSLVSGPVGLTVSASGAVDWSPGQAQIPSSNQVVVKVTDNGSPNLSSTNSFTVTVSGTTDRSVWALGINHPPGTSTSTTFSEFSPQNNINDARPGKVTRLVGDPLYDAATNPAADDDYYMAGTYLSGFNGLTSTLVVPNDEPWKSWEYNHTLGDRTNRLHFPLTAAQVVPGSMLRLSFEFTSMGATIGGVVQGKGAHDFVVNFRNTAGVSTTIFSQQLTALTNIVLTFPATSVAASAGGNTLEFIRTGPAVTGTSYYLIYDYLLLEVGADGRLPGGSLSSLAPLARHPVPQVTTTAQVATAPRAWYSIVTVEGNDYFAISYVEPGGIL